MKKKKKKNVVKINGCVMMVNAFQEIDSVMIGLIVMMDLMKRTVKKYLNMITHSFVDQTTV